MNVYLDDLIEWMNSLELEKTVELTDLFSGKPIAEALHKIDPLFFNAAWLDKIPHYDENANWRVKANNLRKTYRRLTEYYADRLGAELTPEWTIDVSRIAEHNDSDSLCRFLQLVLGAAVLGPNSEIFVRALLNQSNAVQMTSMSVAQVIKELLPKPHEEEAKNSDDSEAAEPTESKEQVADLKNKVESLEQECTQLNEKLKEACSEREVLSSDNESLRLRVDEIESLQKQMCSLRSLRDSIRDALYKTEAERDHLKETNVHLLDENEKLRTKVQGMVPLETECKRLKDELEEYRYRAQEYDKLGNQINSYKAKIKECSTQKAEMKVLEEKVATYMHSVVALEDEQRKNGVLKTQIESLRLENTELNTRLGDAIRRADKTEFECNQLSERISEIEKERDHLRQERHELSEQLLLRVEDNGNAPSLHDETTGGNSIAVLRERIVRLEAENERLLAGNMTDEEKLVLKEEVNALTVQKKSLETELKLAQTRGDDLEKRLKEVNEIVDSAKFANNDRLTEQQTTNEKMAVQIAQLEARLKQAARDLEQAVAEKNTANENLAVARQQVQDEKDKLTRYMEKARRMIEDLEEQNRAVEGGALSRHEFDSIRRERDAYKQNIETLKENQERGRVMQEQEQRLFSTHAYYMMMQLQQRNSTAGQHSDEKSFLTRQRQCGSFNIMSLLAAVLCLMLALTFFSMNSPSLYNEVSFTGHPPS